MIYAVKLNPKDRSLIPRMEAISSGWRLSRADVIRHADGRMRSLAAGLILDYALKAEGLPPLSRVDLSPYGKPLADGVFFSLTHCEGLAACVLSKAPVGIDAEPRRIFAESLRPKIFTKDEIEQAASSNDSDLFLTRLWTLKESLIKARGIGLSEGPKNFAFTLSGDSVTGPPGYKYKMILLPEFQIAVSESLD